MTRAKKTKIDPNTACVCGQPLPMHLVDILVGPGAAHICSCERKYTSDGTTWTCVGTAPNPFAQHDRRHGKN